MCGKRLVHSLVFGVLLVSTVPAQEPADSKPANTEPRGPEAGRAKEAEDGSLRLYLMEGSIVTGELSVGAISVETEFGTLQIPISSIVSFTPGLDSHPQERQRIGRLIQQLGSNVAAERDAAQKALVDIGLPIRTELERYAKDDDAERRTRVQQILEEFEEIELEDDYQPSDLPVLIAQDTVETTLFTVVGKISPQSFSVNTKFGPLTVALRDVRRGKRDTEKKGEIRKNVSVAGTHLVQIQFKSSGVRVSRGDKVSITADGQLVMTPWGNNMVSTPEGGANFQWYIPNEIPGGALVAKIGSSGKIFKVGSKHSFTVTRSGELHFAVAMNAQFANQGYNFPGQYNVKIRVNPQ